MPRYIILMNLTEQGVKNIKEAPARVQEAARALEAAGGKMVDFYTVLGQHDYVCIADVPSDEVGLMQLLGIGAAGSNAATEFIIFHPRYHRRIKTPSNHCQAYRWPKVPVHFREILGQQLIADANPKPVLFFLESPL